MKMKRNTMIAAILAAALCLPLAACGKPSVAPTTTEPTSQTETAPTQATDPVETDPSTDAPTTDATTTTAPTTETSTTAPASTTTQPTSASSTKSGTTGADTTTAPKTTTTKSTTQSTTKQTTKATTKPSTTKSTTKATTKATTQSTTKPSSGIPADSYVAKYVVPVVSGGSYTVAMRDGGGDKVTYAVSGGKRAIDVTTSDGVTAKVIADGTHVYCCVPFSAMEEEMSAEDAAMVRSFLGIGKDGGIYVDISKTDAFDEEYAKLLESSDAIFSTASLRFVSRENVTKSGKSYVCETYSSGGDTLRYYFDGTTLARVESTHGGSTNVLWVTDLRKGAAKSAFKIPSGYKDMTSLLSLMQ